MTTTLSITSTPISAEDLYNYLYWDHRIYDLRLAVQYANGHICRAHHMDPSTIRSIDDVAQRDAKIDDDFGRAEHPSRVILYHHEDPDALESSAYDLFIAYLKSPRNPRKTALKHIHILKGGYSRFHNAFPFLCSDHPHYQDSCQLVWPSLILPDLFLGSSMCRNTPVIRMLGITHVLSFSDFPERNLSPIDANTLHWQLSDSLSTTLLPIFPTAVSWISRAIDDEQGRVLIHCDQGVSRSATIAIAYLLYRYPEQYSTVQAALEQVQSKRNIIRPNASFVRQLEEYALALCPVDKKKPSANSDHWK